MVFADVAAYLSLYLTYYLGKQCVVPCSAPQCPSVLHLTSQSVCKRERDARLTSLLYTGCARLWARWQAQRRWLWRAAGTGTTQWCLGARFYLARFSGPTMLSVKCPLSTHHACLPLPTPQLPANV
jgi:hypothetical protein